MRSPLLIAVTLSATSLGIIVPILNDAGQSKTKFGLIVIAGSSVAEVVPIVVLSVLFSAEASGWISPLALLAAFLGFVVSVGAVIAGAERTGRLTATLLTLQETTAEIRVRGAVALLMVFAALAARFGLEAILGAFLAGATLKILDRDQTGTHTLLRVKLRAIGFGVFVPFFFVATGMSLDVRALIEDPATLTRVPIFLVALLIVRSVPVFCYRPFARGRRQLVAAGLIQATSLSFPVVAGAIGVGLGLIYPSNYAALVAAGLLSVLIFPLMALKLLPSPPSTPTTEHPSPTPGRRRRRRTAATDEPNPDAIAGATSHGDPVAQGAREPGRTR